MTIGNNFVGDYLTIHVRWVPCHHAMARLRDEDGV
jgi:hypothetical protein